MKKIISFSLWGENPVYTVGAIKNADLAKIIYPDWICRYYLGKSVSTEIVDSLVRKDNTEVYVMNEVGDWTGMFWRFYPASDSDVDVMISRDTDCRLDLREKAAVNEWLSGNKDFHIMRDHPYHVADILGGMWGVRNGLLFNIKQYIQNFSMGDYWQVDQKFLKEKIYPVVKKHSCVHDEFFEKKPFPTPRELRKFVGQAYNENDDLLHPEHELLISMKAHPRHQKSVVD